MGWNEIVNHESEYRAGWKQNLEGEDLLRRYKTKQLMEKVADGTIEKFDGELMIMVMDHIMVFEDGRLQIKFYDGTVFEVATD